MSDLELAKNRLKRKSLSLVIVKEGKLLFESRLSGINGLLEAIDKLSDKMHQSSVADKVVGRAAALLLAYSHVRETYAETVSKEGLKVLRENDVAVEYAVLVPQILDRTGKNICPFEKFSSNIKSPSEAYERLKAFAMKLNPNGL
ncbi:DUF1893 domain-containing protein [Candidatus Bathyarchaeota archaeon]|nr:MAG: DUF1893 domain-containing protein [Candidatus Bathyarchaeota archaeon]